MMLPELTLLLDAIELSGAPAEPPVMRPAIERLVLDENILAKRTTSARGTTLKKLAELYGLYELPIVSRALLTLWGRDPATNPHLALLCALARDPLLRASADVIFGSGAGENVTSEMIHQRLLQRFPDRFTESTISALAKRCAATWTQAGHLGALPHRQRHHIRPTALAVAYAIQIAKLAGFSGEAALASPWVSALDLDTNGAAHLARRAEAEGLLRIRSAGHVYDLEIRGALAETMGGNGGVTLI
jgi:transcriptional regulator with XRE-family HTH domain